MTKTSNVKWLAAAFGVLCMLLAGSAALADPMLFEITGSFGSPATMDGSITIDTTTGAVTAIDIDVSGISPGFYNVTNVEAIGDDVEVDATNGVSAVSQLVLIVATSPNPGTFVGFIGGTIVNAMIVDATGFVALGGTGTVAPAAIPEPSMLALLAVGLIAVGGVRVGRRG